MRRTFTILLAVTLLLVSSVSMAAAANGQRQIGINVVLNQDISDAVVRDISRFGRVNDTFPQIDALTMKVREADLAAVQALPYVAAAAPDAKRIGKPVPTAPMDDFAAGMDSVVSTTHIEELGLRLKVGSHVLIPQARHEILQESEDIRKDFWAAFDAYLGVNGASVHGVSS